MRLSRSRATSLWSLSTLPALFALLAPQLLPSIARADDVVDLSDDSPPKKDAAKKEDKGDAKKSDDGDKKDEPKKPASTSTGTAGSPEMYHDYGPPSEEDMPPPDRGNGTHGSQVASSELLPIFLGGATGVVIGGLVGSAFDNAQPPVAGGLLGVAIGGFTGASAGAWLIRGIRDKDTRWAGALTGLGVGGAIGTALFAKLQTRDNDALPLVGKVLAVSIVPLMGAVAGRQLAIYLGGDAKPEEKPKPRLVTMVRPSIVTNGSTMIVGVDGLWF